jgi:Protein of unknown function (DUF2892)
MKANMGEVDRGLRVAAGVVLIGLAATGTVAHIRRSRVGYCLAAPTVTLRLPVFCGSPL